MPNKKPKIKVSLQPNAKAKKEIKSAARSMGHEMSYDKVAHLTGYSVDVVKEALRHYRKPLAPGRPSASATQKPTFIEEIERTTGLTAMRIATKVKLETWWLLSPNNFPIAVVIGSGNMAQSIKLMQNPVCMFQGITQEDLEKRKKNRIKAKEKEQKANEITADN